MAKKDFSTMFDVGSWTSWIVLNNLAFVLFLGFLATLYIANAHMAERNVREIQLLQKDLKEMRWYYMSLEADNMYNAKRSEVARRVRENGLFSPSQAPKRVIVKEE
ncbi:MAG TPA: FtsL-like putative cell division protein [Saprospiraceae bacterium]|nr:hypothetical protein [Lewinellaceae bacterium]HQU57937.1 FtsL-like putative cell division protein [Saprospiraceae bacterium]